MRKIVFVSLMGLFVLGFGCNANAQTTETATRTVTVNVPADGTETSTFYYDKNNQRVLHGPFVVKVNDNKGRGGDEYYLFVYNETTNYKHGVKDGPYSYSKKYELKGNETYSDGYRKKKSYKTTITNHSITGAFKEGKRDGIWRMTYSTQSTVDGKVLQSETGSTNISETYVNGELVKVTFKDGTTLTFENRTNEYGERVAYANGKYEKYIIKNGIATNFYLRDDLTPGIITDPQLKDIMNSESPLDRIDDIIELGYGLRGWSIDCESLSTMYVLGSTSEIGDFRVIFRPKFYTLEDGKYALKTEGWGKTYLKQTCYYKAQQLLKNHGFLRDGSYYYFKKDVFEQLKPYAEKCVKEIREVYNRKDSMENAIFVKLFTQNVNKKSVISTVNSSEDRNIKEYYTDGTSDGFKETVFINLLKNIDYEWDKFTIIYYDHMIDYPISSEVKQFLENEEQILNIYEKFIQNTRYIDSLKTLNDSLAVYNVKPVVVNFDCSSVSMKDLRLYANKLLDGIAEANAHISHLSALKELNAAYIRTRPLVIATNRDVNQFDALCKSVKTEWTGKKDDGSELRKMTSNLNNYYSYLNAYKQVEDNNKEIESLVSEAKDIRKIYQNYFSGIDMKRNGNEGSDRLDKTIEIQEKLMRILKTGNIPEINKNVKKSKVTSMEEMLLILDRSSIKYD